MDTTRNGAAKTETITLEQIHERKQLVQAEIELAQLQRQQTYLAHQKKLLESISLFGDGWGNIVDPREVLPDPGFRVTSWVDQPSDRMHGRDWPLWQTEQELGILRQSSYNLCRINS